MNLGSSFGAGLGTVRASSFLIALLSNVGVLGTALFLQFLFRLGTGVAHRRPRSIDERTIGLSALAASFAQIVSATVSGSSTDLGLLFSVTSGLATGYALGPLRERRLAGTAASPLRPPVRSAIISAVGGYHARPLES